MAGPFPELEMGTSGSADVYLQNSWVWSLKTQRQASMGRLEKFALF